MVAASLRTAAVAFTWVVISAESTSAQTPSSSRVDSLDATGTFAPTGPPSGAPRRVDAGGACVVDVRQDYDVGGTLRGTFEVDFRILVHGPCGSPPGTFEEEWIAVGRFSGLAAARQVSSGFTYTAVVRGDGEVRGRIRFGPELDGEVIVSGRFSDGGLAYSGWIDGQAAAAAQRTGTLPRGYPERSRNGADQEAAAFMRGSYRSWMTR